MENGLSARRSTPGTQSNAQFTNCVTLLVPMRHLPALGTRLYRRGQKCPVRRFTEVSPLSDRWPRKPLKRVTTRSWRSIWQRPNFCCLDRLARRRTVDDAVQDRCDVGKRLAGSGNFSQSHFRPIAEGV